MSYLYNGLVHKTVHSSPPSCIRPYQPEANLPRKPGPVRGDLQYILYKIGKTARIPSPLKKPPNAENFFSEKGSCNVPDDSCLDIASPKE